MHKCFYILLSVLLLLSASCKSNNKRGSDNNCKVQSNYNGIDVSHHQGNIDWDEVAKDTAIQYVYMKATEGTTYTDATYAYNHRMARKNGLKVGAYHFLSSKSGARAQFFHFLEVVSVESVDLIPMLDIELPDPDKCSWSKQQAQDSIQVWIDLCKLYFGKAPILYGTQRSYNTWCAPRFNNYYLYIGRYGQKIPVIEDNKGNLSKEKYSIWQFSDKGTIRGIPKPVDLSRFKQGVTVEQIKLLKK